MRVVFMGTPTFAVPSLEALAGSYDVVSVYTRPDSASRRGSLLHPTPVREAAERLGLQVRTPATLRDSAEHEALLGLRADIGVVAAYGVILPREILEAPRLGFVNVHASLLPRWRGAAPVQRAILAGDAETGVSIMRMEEDLDTGPCCEVARTEVDGKNADRLADELAALGARALLVALRHIEDGTCVWTPQDDSEVTYAAKITKDDVLLSSDLTLQDVLRRVRASSEQTPARLRLGPTVLTVLEARESNTPVEAGIAVRERAALHLGVRDGVVELVRVKPEGRKAMDASAWARGTDLADGTRWGPVR